MGGIGGARWWRKIKGRLGWGRVMESHGREKLRWEQMRKKTVVLGPAVAASPGTMFCMQILDLTLFLPNQKLWELNPFACILECLPSNWCALQLENPWAEFLCNLSRHTAP